MVTANWRGCEGRTAMTTDDSQISAHTANTVCPIKSQLIQFKRFIAALRRIHWVVHCKAPFAGPEQVLRYLSRYTHRVAISNRRLVAADNTSIAFRWKDYHINGPGRWKTIRLHPHEFIRRFLMHVLPKGFHRIRHNSRFSANFIR